MIARSTPKLGPDQDGTASARALANFAVSTPSWLTGPLVLPGLARPRNIEPRQPKHSTANPLRIQVRIRATLLPRRLNTPRRTWPTATTRKSTATTVNSNCRPAATWSGFGGAAVYALRAASTIGAAVAKTTMLIATSRAAVRSIRYPAAVTVPGRRRLAGSITDTMSPSLGLLRAHASGPG